MADPIFQKRPELLAALQLSTAPAARTPVIDAGIKAARAEFWRRLTQSRITEILQTDETESPQTDAQHLRALATITEQMVVRLHLLMTMSTAFKDGSGGAQQEWNDEGFLRGSNTFQRDSDRKQLEAAIAQNMDLLAGDESAGEESRVEGEVIGATNPTYLGASFLKNDSGIFAP